MHRRKTTTPCSLTPTGSTFATHRITQTAHTGEMCPGVLELQVDISTKVTAAITTAFNTQYAFVY